ncbi:MAG: hypothetical protein M3O09_08440 [Acidobacteriota bacterium]|nr:hypothetical protein [Acidobacteriota bacterium]
MTGTPDTPELREPASTPTGTIPAAEISRRHGGAVLHEGSEKSAGARQSGLAIWLHRVGMLIFVSICAVVGVVLVILPWRPEWTDNHLLLSYPGLRTFVTNSFVRGLCSGLGALDIWIGFSQAITYHEESRA